MTKCPTSEKLSGLIQGALPRAEQESLTDHLGECACCQESIETIASGEIPVQELASKSLDLSPPDQSAYWRVVKGLDEDVKSTRAFTGGSSGAPTFSTESVKEGDTERELRRISKQAHDELDFLSPSEDPAYLGMLQHFQIARVIGRGGMGIVLEAFDPHLHRRVAIKVLNPQFQANEVARQRFCREGRAAAAIAHEHVVPMYQVSKFNDGKIAFLVMQLIEGDTLEERLQVASPFPPSEVARIGMQIAAGLSAAHASDMVHRDIKPANVLIERETDRVKLTDFGLARAADDVKLTQTGMVTGTPLYMSPEQALGNSPDERSDLFSLGAVMYEMATGVSPFQAPTAVGVMKRIMDEDPKSPHSIDSNVSERLSSVIMALISKSPDDRPNSAADVAQTLAGIVTGYGPISPLQVPAVAKSGNSHSYEKLGTSLSSNFNLGWIAASTMFILLLVVTGIWLAGVGQPKEVNEDTTPSATFDGEIANDMSSKFPSTVLPDNPGTVWAVDFAPDGKRIVAAVEDGSVRVWDIEKQEVVKSFNAHRGIVWMARFHPTLNLVATTGDDGKIKLWDANSFELIREWQAENSVRGIAFSADSKRIVAGDREGKIHVYDLESGAEIATHTQTGAILGIDFSSDGKLIATVSSDKIVRVYDTETFEQRQTLTGHDGPVYNVAFAPSGPLMATVGWGNNIRIWNVETGAQVDQLKGGEGDVWGVKFCGLGTHLVTGGHDGAARIWDLSDGSNTAVLKGHSSAVHNIALDPNGYRIATSSRDGSIRVWDMSELEHGSVD